MNAYVSKPVDMDVMLGVIGRLMNGRPQESVRGVGSGSAEGVPVPLLDIAWINKVYGTRREVGRKLVDMYLAELPRSLEEIRETLDASDAVALARHAHTLKGSSGVLGASGVGGLALRLEQAARGGDMELAKRLFEELREICGRTMSELPGAMA